MMRRISRGTPLVPKAIEIMSNMDCHGDKNNSGDSNDTDDGKGEDNYNKAVDKYYSGNPDTLSTIVQHEQPLRG